MTSESKFPLVLPSKVCFATSTDTVVLSNMWSCANLLKLFVSYNGLPPDLKLPGKIFDLRVCPCRFYCTCDNKSFCECADGCKCRKKLKAHGLIRRTNNQLFRDLCRMFIDLGISYLPVVYAFIHAHTNKWTIDSIIKLKTAMQRPGVNFITAYDRLVMLNSEINQFALIKDCKSRVLSDVFSHLHDTYDVLAKSMQPQDIPTMKDVSKYSKGVKRARDESD